jgi:hypothetical protein
MIFSFIYLSISFPDGCPFLHLLVACYFTILIKKNSLISLVIMSHESSI